MIQFCLRSLKRVCSLLPEKKALQWQPRGMTDRTAQAQDVSSAHEVGRGCILCAMDGSRRLLASDATIGKPSTARIVVVVVMQVMMAMIILRQLFFYPESPA
jgi:hypothetical protein